MMSARNRRRLQRRKVRQPAKELSGNRAASHASAEHQSAKTVAIPFDTREPLTHEPRLHRGAIYRYLDCAEHAQAWISGGRVPLFPASTYLSDERAGIFTPDERRQRSVSSDNPRGVAAVADWFGGVTGSVTFVNSSFHTGGAVHLINATINQSFEDAYVLCFATSCSAELMERLGKRVCVEITDLASLKAALDKQMGERSFSGLVDYTPYADRSHFLKAEDDRWQDEFRFLWRRPAGEAIWVELPPGIGAEITF